MASAGTVRRGGEGVGRGGHKTECRESCNTYLIAAVRIFGHKTECSESRNTYLIAAVRIFAHHRFGTEYSLVTEDCSGKCSEGWYCPAGSTSMTQTPCPPHSFCGQGKTPEACPENYAKSCSGYGVGTCDDGTLCLYGQCSGLEGTLNCLEGDYDYKLCSSLAAVHAREPGEVGCPKDSACEKFARIDATLSWLSWLGGIDVGVVGLGLLFFGIGALVGGGFEAFGKRAVLYFVLPIDIILIVGVELVSYESEMDSLVDFFLAGGCWRSFSAAATARPPR